MKISIILGSTRIGRNSQRVSMALARELENRGVEAHHIDVKDWPVHQFEERVKQIPDAPDLLAQIADKLKTSNAMIFVSPEYNGSYTGSLKNFIDSFSREEFGGKPIGVATVATGKMGGIRAAYHLQQVVLGVGGYPIPQLLLTAEVNRHIDEQGHFQTEEYRVQMDKFLQAYLDFAQRFVKVSVE